MNIGLDLAVIYAQSYSLVAYASGHMAASMQIYVDEWSIAETFCSFLHNYTSLDRNSQNTLKCERM